MARLDRESAPAREARVWTIARSIPSDVDLDDLDDVVRALYFARYSAADFDDVIDDVIARARVNRLEERSEALRLF
jgi:hypothetical protein